MTASMTESQNRTNGRKPPADGEGVSTGDSNAMEAPSASATDRIVIRWMLAAMVAASASVGILGLDVLQRIAPAWAALIAIACGWAAGVLLVPWRSVDELRHDRSALKNLANRISNAMRDGREEPLRRIVIDRDDEIGQLSRVIRDALAQSIAHRVEARMLSRTMDDSIRRETTRATATLLRQVTTDPLTGLGNRRRMRERLEAFGSNGRFGRTISIILFDLDHFKQINDTLGHDVGDQCLVFLGELLKSHLRNEDCAVRLGGDEFVVMLPGLEHRDAQAVARRIESLFAAMPWAHALLPRPGVSFGVSSITSGETVDPDELLRRADRAMYAAKLSHRAA